MKKILYLSIIVCIAGKTEAQKMVRGERYFAERKASFELRNLPTQEPEKFPRRPERLPSPNMADSRLHYRPKSEERRAEKEIQARYVREVKAVTPAVIQQRAFNASSSSVAGPNIFETPCVSTRGMSVFGLRPPDVTSAAGADYVMLADNDSTCIMTKSGNIVWREKQSLGNGFWSPADTTGLFDPKLTYDPLAHRWIYVICADASSATSSFIVAVSASYDPFGGWFIYHIDADADNNQWFDYPSVGFNRNWIVVTGNMFQNPGFSVASECRTFVFNKSQMYAGAGVGFSIFNASNEYSTICPALTYDAGENDLWCATNDDVDDNDIRYFRVGGTAAAPTFTEEGFISITGDWGSGNTNIAPQSGNSARIHGGDHDILSAVFRGGRMYTAQTIFTPDAGTPTTCTMQLISCTPGSTTVHEALRFASDGNSMYAFPNLTVNANGDWIISCARFSNTIFPSAAVLVRRAGNPTFFETIFQGGQDWYLSNDNFGRNRWGDYSGCMIDPMDDNSVWVSGEYSIVRGPANVGNWASWVTKICSGVCNANTFVNTVQATGTIRKFEASGTVFANNTIQSGTYIKLDGGSRVVLQPGFRANNGAKVRAFVEGCGGTE
jgi:hypothetical protein